VLDWACGRPTRELEALVAKEIPGRAVKDRIRWIDEGSVELRFAADRRCAEMLERAREISRHTLPDGRYGDIIMSALDAYLTIHDWDLARPSSGKRESDPHGRHVPASVKRAVWQRDQGRCSYVSSRGRRCGSRAWIEFDHIQPLAEGGRSDIEDNIRLLCRTHNQRLARERFGIRALPKRPQAETLPLLPRDGSASAARRIESDPPSA
jgi:5-methylcytosine-specific restriction endonuclease McrA